MPWTELLILVAIAFVVSLAMTWLPSRSAGRRRTALRIDSSLLLSREEAGISPPLFPFAEYDWGTMLRVRRDDDIYRKEGGWFSARWHFSFDDYRDPENDSFGAMRVFNDDRLIPGAIWPLHPHRDIEGLTYVVEGLFGHEDDVGGGYGPLPAGSVQRMTLGSGALHSEQNASQDEPMRFIQIWILPDTADLEPQVEQRTFTKKERTDRLLKVMGPEGGEVVKIHQNASLYIASLGAGVEVTQEIGEGRGLYAYIIDGRATFDEEAVRTGDAAKVTDKPSLRIRAEEGCELILVDVPMRFEPVGIWAGRI